MERKLRERIRRKRLNVERKFNNSLSEWLRLRHRELFSEFTALFNQIETTNPTVNNLTSAFEWRIRVEDINGEFYGFLENDFTVEERLFIVFSIFLVECSVANDNTVPSVISTPIDVVSNVASSSVSTYPNIIPNVMSSSARIVPSVATNMTAFPECVTDGDSLDRVVNEIVDILGGGMSVELDPFEEVKKHFTDFDYELEMLDYECFDEFDSEQFEEDMNDIELIDFSKLVD